MTKTIPNFEETKEIVLPVEGDERTFDGVLMVWTVHTDDGCSIGQWKRKYVDYLVDFDVNLDWGFSG